MSNYNSLKATIDANIKQNGNQEITGQILNSVLNAMVTTLGTGYQFAGVATIATNPGTPDAKVFYIANGKGTYEKFGGLEVTEDDVVVLYYDTAWHKVSTGIASQAKLSELEGKVSEIDTQINGKSSYIEGKALDYNGQIQDDSNYCISQRIPVAQGQEVSVTATVANLQTRIVEYNADGRIMDRWAITSTLLARVFTPNVATSYIIVSFDKNDDNVSAMQGSAEIWRKGYTKGIDTEIGNLEELDTDNKSSLVNAVNEVVNSVNSTDAEIVSINKEIYGVEGRNITNTITLVDGRVNYSRYAFPAVIEAQNEIKFSIDDTQGVIGNNSITIYVSDANKTDIASFALTPGYPVRKTFASAVGYIGYLASDESIQKDGEVVLSAVVPKVDGVGDKVNKSEKNYLYGRKYASLGDSITQRDHWQKVIDYYMGMTHVNYGCGGMIFGGFAFHHTTIGSEDPSHIGETVADRLLNAADFVDCDIIIICGTANDWALGGTGKAIGSMDDPFVTISESACAEYASPNDFQSVIKAQDFIPEMRSTIEYLQTICPNARIVVSGQLLMCTSYLSGFDATSPNFYQKNSRGLGVFDYADAMKLVSEHYALPFIDLARTSGINNLNWRVAYDSPDTNYVHPNFKDNTMGDGYPDSGMKRMALAMMSSLRDICL